MIAFIADRAFISELGSGAIVNQLNVRIERHISLLHIQ